MWDSALQNTDVGDKNSRNLRISRWCKLVSYVLAVFLQLLRIDILHWSVHNEFCPDTQNAVVRYLMEYRDISI